MFSNSTQVWHWRPGHASHSTMNEMIRDKRLADVEIKDIDVCDMCATAKQVRKTLKVSDEVSEVRESARSNAVVCSDVLGHITPALKSGLKYIVIFIMMKSRYVMIYPLCKKSDVLSALTRYAQVLSGMMIKVLKSDNGGEHRNAGIHVSASRSP